METDKGIRLNLGCGYNRLEGWLNADASPYSAADRVMEAQDLEFGASSVEEVKALQLVEHLGFFRTKYFLSECWRVLKPGGRLTIETPDVDAAFRAYLAGGHSEKESALGWIFGPESPGMHHLYCFPRELLAELLAEAGFSVEKQEGFLFQPSRPALRFSAVKKEGEKAALNSALRRRLLDRGLAAFTREEESAGLELAVRRLVAGGGNSAAELEQALISAPAALEYFALVEENEPRPSREAAACGRLASWSAQGRLAAAFLEGLRGGLDENAAFSAAESLGRRLLAAALEGGVEPPGPRPLNGAPAAFTFGAVSAWAFREKAGGRR
ncbi:MAG: methyltransferase domain-containing protein [Elusimicrobia bacterium]|nr:methyltransferase domain-containing protein [Elusimicrobiota bacterium]